jgi:hypothetical protein
MGKIKYVLLNDSNYGVWRATLNTTYAADGLSLILGPTPDPLVDVAAWNINTAKAKQHLILSVDGFWHEQLLNSTTVREALSILEKHYAINEVQYGVVLEKKLMGMKLEEGGDLAAYLLEYNSTFHLLEKTQSKWSEHKRCIHFLHSLTHSLQNFWAPYLSACIKNPNKVLLWADIQLDFYILIQVTHNHTSYTNTLPKTPIPPSTHSNSLPNHTHGEEKATALRAGTREQDSSADSDDKPIQCYSCKGYGHYANECPEKGGKHKGGEAGEKKKYNNNKESTTKADPNFGKEMDFKDLNLQIKYLTDIKRTQIAEYRAKQRGEPEKRAARMATRDSSPSSSEISEEERKAKIIRKKERKERRERKEKREKEKATKKPFVLMARVGRATPNPISNPTKPPNPPFPTNNPIALRTSAYATAPAKYIMDHNPVDTWILDSGATDHMSGNPEVFTDIKPLPTPLPVHGIGNSKLFATHVGTVSLHSTIINSQVILENTLYVPQLGFSLLSSSTAVMHGAKICLEVMTSHIQINGHPIFSVSLRDKLFIIDIKPKIEIVRLEKREGLRELSWAAKATSLAIPPDLDIQLWHERLGHINGRRIEALSKGGGTGIPQGLKASQLEQCQICIMAKQTRKPINKTVPRERAPYPLHTIHSDLAGPFHVPSFGGARFYMTLICDNCSWTRIYYLKYKSEAIEKWREFRQEMATQFPQYIIKIFRSDRGGEFTGKVWEAEMAKHGILLNGSAPYTPEHMGMAERKNRTIMESTRAMLKHSGMPRQFWAEASHYAVMMSNRSPTTLLNGKTPHHPLYGCPPALENFHVFGCRVLARQEGHRNKLDDRTREAIFLTPSWVSSGFRLWDPINNTIITSRTCAIFDDRVPRTVLQPEGMGPWKAGEDLTNFIEISKVVRDFAEEYEDDDPLDEEFRPYPNQPKREGTQQRNPIPAKTPTTATPTTELQNEGEMDADDANDLVDSRKLRNRSIPRAHSPSHAHFPFVDIPTISPPKTRRRTAPRSDDDYTNDDNSNNDDSSSDSSSSDSSSDSSSNKSSPSVHSSDSDFIGNPTSYTSGESSPDPEPTQQGISEEDWDESDTGISQNTLGKKISNEHFPPHSSPPIGSPIDTKGQSPKQENLMDQAAARVPSVEDAAKEDVLLMSPGSPNQESGDTSPEYPMNTGGGNSSPQSDSSQDIRKSVRQQGLPKHNYNENKERKKKSALTGQVDPPTPQTTSVNPSPLYPTNTEGRSSLPPNDPPPDINSRKWDGPPPKVIIQAPTTLYEATSGPQSTQWNNAMREELGNMGKKKVFKLVPAPPHRHPITARWVFAIKRDAEGNISRYKARLVARGFVQRKGIDFDETFASVARMTSMRIVMAIAAQEGMELQQIDVDQAFLNGLLDKEIYMHQPPGFQDKDHPNWVWLLLKSIYGLRQASRIWQETLHAALMELGFTQLESDPCVYIRYPQGEVGREENIVIAIHVDDFLLAGKRIAINLFKSQIAKFFDIKDIGVAKMIVGIQVDQSPYRISINQGNYVNELLLAQGMQDCNPSPIPLSGGELKKIALCDPVSLKLLPSPKEFQHLTGKFQYLAGGSRPEISFSVSQLCKFNSKPTAEHMALAKRLLRYLAGRPKGIITYTQRKQGLLLDGFADSDFADSYGNAKSQSGYIWRINKAPICWSSQQQGPVAQSTGEAEYYAANLATREGVWLRCILSQLGYPQTLPSIIYEDNTSCIAMSKNPIHHKRTKHINIAYNYLRKAVEDGEVFLRHISTTEQIADVLTKPLDRVRFEYILARLGLKFG